MARRARPSGQTTSTRRDWLTGLKQLIQSRGSVDKVALVGIGHPLRGDDYAGSHIMKIIIKQTSRIQLQKSIYLYDAEDQVEAVITRLADLLPQRAIFVDSCDMNSKPGTATLLPIDEIGYPFFTTHGIPLKVLAEHLLPNSAVWVLAIQPKQINLGEEMSKEVRSAADSISNFITSTLEEMRSENAD